MGKLGTIGGLIGELADKVLDYLEDKSDEETKDIQQIEIIDGKVIEDKDEG